MNLNIIFILEIAQYLWWLILSLIFDWTNTKIIIAFSSLAISLKLVLYIIFKKLKHQNHVIIIIFMLTTNLIIYTELNLLILDQYNSFSNHTNTLLIVINYKLIKKIIKQRNSFWLLKFTYPFYITVRLLAILFQKFDYFILESIIIIIMVLFSIQLTDSLLQKKNNDLIQRDKIKTLKQFKDQPQSFDILKDQEKILNQSNLSNKNQSCDQFLTALQHSIRYKPSNDNDKTESFSNYLNCHLFDFITQGILIIDQNQKIQYINKKCFNLFQKNKEEQVLTAIKDCLENINVQKNSPELSYSSYRNKTILNQQILEDLISSFKQNNQNFDVLDIILNQQKYLQQYFKSKDSNEYEKNSFDESPISQKKIKIFKFNLQTQQNKFIKLKIIPIQQCASSNSPVQGYKPILGEQQQQTKLFIILKNISSKKQLKQLTNKIEFKNQLLQNMIVDTQILSSSNQSLLNFQIQKQRHKNYDHHIHPNDNIVEKQNNDQFKLIFTLSLLLFYQLNTLKDIILQENQSFQYKFDQFQIKEIIKEVERVFFQLTTFKFINFQIKINENLVDKIFNSDKQRILQALFTLMYFFLNKIKCGGELILTISNIDEAIIQFSLFQNEQIMQENGQSQKKINYKLKDKENQNSNLFKADLNTVLNISAQLIEGLVDTNDNQLEIFSNQSGSMISFWVQNYDLSQSKEQIQIRNISNTGKFVNVTRSGTSKEENVIIRRISNYISEYNHHDSLVVKSEAIKSNESPNCFDDFSEKIIIPQANYFQFKSLESPNQIIANKTFSFKVSTLQVHECTQMCEKILIIDEQFVNLITLKQLLSYYQIQCDLAFSGFQAISKISEKIQTLCQFYHLIFINPNISGLRLKDLQKQFHPQGEQKQNFVFFQEKNNVHNKYLDEYTNYCEVLEKPVSQLELQKILKKPKDNPSETYSYYTLPYCQPDDAEQIIETLGQSLSGDQKMTSFYSFYSNETIIDQQICQKNYTQQQLQDFRKAIDQNYIIEFYLNDFIMHDIVGKHYNGQYYLKNRITFNLYVNKEKILVFANITQFNDLKEFTKFNSESDSVIIQFYFTVNIIEAKDDLEFYQHDHSIKWNLLIFKNFVIVILIIFIFKLIRRAVLNDYTNLPDEDEENSKEAEGWKAYKVEALMPPKNRIIFSALLGTGTHLLITILILLILGAFDLFETHKGSIKSAGIIIYSFAGTLNGYYTGKFYKFYGGKSWLLNLFIAAVIFPMSAFSVFFIVDAFGFLLGTTATFSFSAVFSISFILCVVYLPLTLIGGVSGRLRTIDELYEKRLKKKVLTNDLLFISRGLVFGIIPFLSIIFELYYILESTWSDQFFEYYKLLIISYFQLIIIIGCLSIIQTYNQLKSGNYNWQWISFINGGFCSLYIFIFSFFYYYFVNMHGFFQFLSYFAENILVCFALWIMLGFVSYWISLKFVIYIYTQNRIQ